MSVWEDLYIHGFLKYKDDVESFNQAIVDETVSEGFEDNRVKIEKFHELFDCIPMIHDELTPVLIDRLAIAKGIKDLIPLIRWHKGRDLRSRIKDCYEKTVFIIDDDATFYKTPKDVHAFGFVKNMDGKYDIIDENKELFLTTPFAREVIWFAAVTCKYALVASKGEGAHLLDGSVDIDVTKTKNELVKAFQHEKGLAVFAAPGKIGSYSNYLLKTNRDVIFIDCWNDIIKQINK